MKLRNVATIDLTVTTSSDPISVDNTDIKSVLTIFPIDNLNTFFD